MLISLVFYYTAELFPDSQLGKIAILTLSIPFIVVYLTIKFRAYVIQPKTVTLSLKRQKINLDDTEYDLSEIDELDIDEKHGVFHITLVSKSFPKLSLLDYKCVEGNNEINNFDNKLSSKISIFSKNV